MINQDEDPQTARSQSQRGKNTQSIKYSIYQLNELFESEQNPRIKVLLSTRLALLSLLHSQEQQIILKCLDYLLQQPLNMDQLSACLQIVQLPEFTSLFPQSYRFYRVQVTVKLRDFYFSLSKIKQFRECNKYLLSELQLLLKRNQIKDSPQTQLLYARQLINCYQLMLWGSAKSNPVEQSIRLHEIIKMVEEMPYSLTSQLQEQLMNLYYQQGEVHNKLKYSTSAERAYQMSLNIAKRLKSDLEWIIVERLRRMKKL